MPWLLVLLCLLAGCAPRLASQDPEALHSLWKRLHQPSPAGITARFSLHVDSPRLAGRVLAELVGVPGDRLLLTITSSVGSTLALVEETAGQTLAYVPEQNTAVLFSDPHAVLPAQGIPLPLSLTQLASLVAGDWSPILPPFFRAARARNGMAEFELDAPYARLLVAADRSVQVHGGDGMEIVADMPAPDDSGRLTRFTFTLPQHGSAIVRVKEYAVSTTLPDPLVLPVGVERKPFIPKETTL